MALSLFHPLTFLKNVSPQLSILPSMLYEYTFPRYQVWLTALNGNKVGIIELNPTIWGQEIRVDLVHRCVLWQRNNRRTGYFKTKHRGEVSGSGRKPWPQKGTGRKRAGDLRAPHMKGGGRAHPKTVRDWRTNLPRSIRNKALRIVLSAKYSEGRLKLIDDDEFKISEVSNIDYLISLLSSLGYNENNTVTVCSQVFNEQIIEKSQEIKWLNLLIPNLVNPYDLLKKKNFLLTLSALSNLELSYKQEKPLIDVLSFDNIRYKRLWPFWRRKYLPILMLEQRRVTDLIASLNKSQYSHLL